MSALKPIVVIVESPAKCSKIEEFLGPGYKVVASFGHLTTLKSLKDIDIKNNYKPTFNIIDSKKDKIVKLRKIINNSSKVIIATDDDREGEAIGYHLCCLFNLPISTTPRIIFNEITKGAILNAIKTPTLLNMDLINAAIARQVLDMLVGFIISPMLWKKFARNSNDGLSAGRCQSPALRLVYDNYKEINDSPGVFVYTTTGYFTKENIPFVLNYQYTTDDDIGIEQFLEESVNFKHTFKKGKQSIKTKNQPQPFTTSALQQSANSNLRITPKNTMKICQKLYESGLITYMRTDSKIYSKEFINKATKYIKSEYGDEYVNKNIKLLSEHTKNKSNKKEDNNKVQEAHEAIRPTDITKINIDNVFDSREIRMYKLIWKNTVESCMSPAKYNAITSTITAPYNHIYKYSCDNVIFPGWKIVDGYDKDNPIYNYLLSIKNQDLSYNKIISKVTIKDSKSHYTEAKLVQLLEENGIGRPSTFSNLVDKIQSRGYVKKDNVEGVKKTCIEYELVDCELSENELEKEFGNEKGKLIIQPLGIMVLEFLIECYNNLFIYKYTQQMEDALDNIAQGKLVWYTVCNDCYNCINELSNKITDLNKQEYKLDDKHTWMIGKYGPVIKYREGENISWKKAKKDIDFKKLQSGQYTLVDVLDTLSHVGKNLGIYEENNIILKRGKYGLYIEWGDNKKSLSHLNKEEDDITLEDAVSYIKKPTASVIREISIDLSIRNGKYGPYVFYKTKKMRKPRFLKLKGFILSNEEDYESCDINRLLSWIEETYSIK